MELTVRTVSVVPAGIAAAFREEATTQAQFAIAIRMNVFLLIFRLFGVVVISRVGTNTAVFMGYRAGAAKDRRSKIGLCSSFLPVWDLLAYNTLGQYSRLWY
jgi:hypothetical protein